MVKSQIFSYLIKQSINYQAKLHGFDISLALGSIFDIKLLPHLRLFVYIVVPLLLDCGVHIS